MKTIFPILALLALLAASGPTAAKQPVGAAPASVNVLQDCWTTDLDDDPDVERELYSFTTADSIDFVWKYKLLQSCSAYVATIVLFECTDGKPAAVGDNIRFKVPNISFGQVNPIPGIPEVLFAFTMAAGPISPGRYDWGLFVECDDTNGVVWEDGDVDDVCGLNMGRVLDGPLVLGPEPIEEWDPDPGGSPPGRGPGEKGTTRPWCFQVTDPPPPLPTDGD